MNPSYTSFTRCDLRQKTTVKNFLYKVQIEESRALTAGKVFTSMGL